MALSVEPPRRSVMAVKTAPKQTSETSGGKMVIRSKKATAAEIRATLMIKPTNESAARRANRAAKAALDYRC
jgi:hypothetical protein